MSDMRKILNKLNESFIPGINEFEDTETPSSEEATVEEDSIYKGAEEYADTVEPCCSGSDGDSPDEKFGEDEIYEETDEVDEAVEKEVDEDSEEVTEEDASEVDEDEEQVDEEWESSFNETVQRMKDLVGYGINEANEDDAEEVTEEDEVAEAKDKAKDDDDDEGAGVDPDGDKEKVVVDEADDEEVDEDKEEVDEAKKSDDDEWEAEPMYPYDDDKKEVDEGEEETDINEELRRMQHLSGIAEDSIYPNATHMNTEKKWDEMGAEGSTPDQKFGDDEIYNGEDGPLAHNSHTDRPGEDKMPSAPFSHKMAEAAIAGEKTFEHKGQTFKVRMDEARAKEILG